MSREIAQPRGFEVHISMESGSSSSSSSKSSRKSKKSKRSEGPELEADQIEVELPADVEAQKPTETNDKEPFEIFIDEFD